MSSRSPDPETPRTLAAEPVIDSSGGTFLVALVAATLLHAGAVMLVSFETPLRETGTLSESAMEILILPDAGRDGAPPPPDAALSRLDRSGASSSGDAVYDDPIASLSEEAESAELAAPVPETGAESLEETPVTAEAEPSADREDPAADPAPAPIGIAASMPDPKEVEEAPPEIAEVVPAQPPEPEPEPASRPDPMDARDTPIDAAQILASRGEEIDRLTANLQAKTAAYASRVRRKSVSASTREFRYASYLGAWARKVERIGNLNYPQAARDQRMFGSLILHVAVRSDGSVEQIRVVRSSGYDLLDEAAVRIVELAAPYAPFPPDIAAETDVLDIVRTWQFLRGGGLGWEQ